MDRFHEIAVFVAVADTGGFASAGRRLHLSPAAVTRAVAALEQRLGARLVNRTTRSLSLTEAGLRFLDSARRILAEWDGAAREAGAGGTEAPTGHLTLTATVTFGRTLLGPVVSSFLAAHPTVTASVLLLDRVVNLVDEGIDLAIRIGHLPDSGLVAQKVGPVRRLLVASPDYLARHGTPHTPGDRRDHHILAFTGMMPGRQWRFQRDGRVGTVDLHPRLEINDAFVALEAAERGEGITIALCYMVGDAFRTGRLVPVLIDYTPDPVPVHLVHAQGRMAAPKVRAFMDHAAPRLRSELERVWDFTTNILDRLRGA